MKTTTTASLAFLAAANFLGVYAKDGQQRPVVTPVINQLTSHGCFSTGANFTVEATGAKVTSGYCGDICKEAGMYVSAMKADKCYCGMVYPPQDDLVKDSFCNFPCPAYPQEACGALKTYYSVFNTGLEIAVDDYVPEETTTSSAPSSTKAASSTGADSTAAVTQTDDVTSPSDSSTAGEDDDDKKKKDGPNVAAIAAGVVVGVVVVGAIAAGAIFFVRRRRNAEIEEEHRRNAAVNAFINGSKPPGSSGSISMTDSRLDPVMAHRRLSDGSIADNQDYSRRILRVTNA